MPLTAHVTSLIAISKGCVNGSGAYRMADIAHACGVDRRPRCPKGLACRGVEAQSIPLDRAPEREHLVLPVLVRQVLHREIADAVRGRRSEDVAGNDLAGQIALV